MKVHDWRSDVYGKKNVEDNPLPENWTKIKREVWKRDCEACIRCEKRLFLKSATTHHLMPRDEGGGHNRENLVTLCIKCHDYVEINTLRSVCDIIGSYETPIRRGLRDPAPTRDFHKWVYGGYRRPEPDLDSKSRKK